MKQNKKVPATVGEHRKRAKGENAMRNNIKRYTGSQARNITRTASGVGSFIMMLIMLGTVGGIEKGYLAFKTGAWFLVGESVLLVILLYLAGALKYWRRG